MTIAEIISGLKFTIEMFLFDPNTGEKLTEPRNNMDKITLDACKGAIKALEQQPCEDCISREALRNLKVSVPIAPIFIGDNYIRHRDVIIYDEIIDLPSVTPTRPTGKWIKMPLIEAGQTYSHECSLCGRRILITDVGLSEFPYCHCGARMIESEEERCR